MGLFHWIREKFVARNGTFMGYRPSMTQQYDFWSFFVGERDGKSWDLAWL